MMGVSNEQFMKYQPFSIAFSSQRSYKFNILAEEDVCKLHSKRNVMEIPQQT
jgi:hypothetical protein